MIDKVITINELKNYLIPFSITCLVVLIIIILTFIFVRREIKK